MEGRQQDEGEMHVLLVTEVANSLCGDSIVSFLIPPDGKALCEVTCPHEKLAIFISRR